MWLMRSKSLYDMLNWPLSSWMFFLAGLVGLIVLIWLVVRLIARVNEDSDPAEADRDMLLTLAELRREGDLTQEEFRSIKSRLIQRMSTSDEQFSGKPQSANSAEIIQRTSHQSEAGQSLELTTSQPSHQMAVESDKPLPEESDEQNQSHRDSEL